MEFVDLQGRLVSSSSSQNLTSGEQVLSVSVKDLPDGIYLLRTRTSSGMLSVPVIIHR
jgi:hypothetical protein